MNEAWHEARKIHGQTKTAPIVSGRAKTARKHRNDTVTEVRHPKTHDVSPTIEIVDTNGVCISVDQRKAVTNHRGAILAKLITELTAMSTSLDMFEKRLNTLVAESDGYSDPIQISQEQELGSGSNDPLFSSDNFALLLQDLVHDGKRMNASITGCQESLRSMHKKHRALHRRLVHGVHSDTYMEFVLTDHNLIGLIKNYKSVMRKPKASSMLLSAPVLQSLEWLMPVPGQAYDGSFARSCVLAQRIVCDSPREFCDWCEGLLSRQSIDMLVSCTAVDVHTGLSVLRQFCSGFTVKKLCEFPDFADDYRTFHFDGLVCAFNGLGVRLRTSCFQQPLHSRADTARFFCSALPAAICALCEQNRPDTEEDAKVMPLHGLKTTIVELISSLLEKIILASCSPQGFGIFEPVQVDRIIGHFQIGFSCHAKRETGSHFSLIETIFAYFSTPEFIRGVLERSTNDYRALEWLVGEQACAEDVVTDCIQQMHSVIARTWVPVDEGGGETLAHTFRKEMSSLIEWKTV